MKIIALAAGHVSRISLVSKMKRFLVCATLLIAAIPANSVAAQQGNLPVPMQKLPSYPPVVCVTPNWKSESCASRTPTYGPQNEPSGWQCGNVRIIVSTDSTTFFSTEFLITGIETRDNRFKLVKGELYLNGRLCTSFPEHNKTESLPPHPPVTCLKPDGASEPCENRHASPPHLRTVVVLPEKPSTETPRKVGIPADLRGGYLQHHVNRFWQMGRDGDYVEVRGQCPSGCTAVVIFIPKDRLCFAADAQLAFHMSRKVPPGWQPGMDWRGHEPSTEGVKWLYERYPENIQAWIDAKGGYAKMPLEDWWILTARELWEMGYQRCDSEPPRAPYINPTRSWELVPDKG